VIAAGEPPRQVSTQGCVGVNRHRNLTRDRHRGRPTPIRKKAIWTGTLPSAEAGHGWMPIVPPSGSPIKRPLARAKTLPGKAFLPFVSEDFDELRCCRHFSIHGVSLYCTSHPSGSRPQDSCRGHERYRMALSAYADQKILGSVPCPKRWSNLMVVNQPQLAHDMGSREVKVLS